MKSAHLVCLLFFITVSCTEQNKTKPISFAPKVTVAKGYTVPKDSVSEPKSVPAGIPTTVKAGTPKVNPTNLNVHIAGQPKIIVAGLPKINTPGTGDKPTACSDVTVAYVGRLLNGNIFDQNTGIAFNLSKLIAGWQEAIPLIAKGGSMTLYLPPTLGYGPNAVGPVPANSNLIFDISLK